MALRQCRLYECLPVFVVSESESLEASLRHVFVYGTLRRGDDNDINLLTPKPYFVGIGSVTGVMHHLGDYPGVVLKNVLEGSVVGEVYTITPELERVLDEIEMIYPQQSDEYRKRMVVVQVGADQLDCLFYEINPSYATGKPVIAGGDWVKGR